MRARQWSSVGTLNRLFELRACTPTFGAHAQCSQRHDLAFRKRPPPRSSHPCLSPAQIFPNTLSNSTPANRSTPGLPVHLSIRFPLLVSLQPPASPMASSSKLSVPSCTLLPLVSTIQHPLVHWPSVSTLISSSLVNFQSGSLGQRAYHMVRGSCSCRPIVVGSREESRDRILL